jgi:hypothetical protein
MFGQIGGPLLAGVLDDTTGSFRIGFTIVALTASLGTVCFASATRPVPPETEPEPDPSAAAHAGLGTAGDLAPAG